MPDEPGRPPRGLICLTSSEPPADDGHGSPPEVSELASWLHGQGLAVEIVAGRRRPGRELAEDVPVDLLDSWEERRWPQGLDEASSVVAGMSFRIRRFEPWLVHAFLPADAAAAAMADRPYVVSYGAMIPPDTFTGRPHLWQLFQLVSKGARRIICPSRAAADHLRAMYGLDAEVVPPGIDPGRFAEGGVARQPGLILGPGVLDGPRQRAEVLVDAFARVAARRSEVELVLTGATSEQRRRELLGRLPAELQARCRMPGAVDRSRLPGWYARASVTCLPAVREGFGLPLVESLAAGTPVVGANDGGMAEIVTEEVGAVFVADEAPSCAQAIVDVLEKAGDGAVAGACRERAARYAWDRVGPELLALYDGAAG